MSIVNVEVRSPLLAQAEVWTAHEMDPGDPRFNCGGYIDLVGELRSDIFARAVGHVTRECEALHVVPVPAVAGAAAEADGVPGFSVGGPPELEVLDASSGEKSAVRRMEEDLARPLDLGADALARMILFRLSPSRHLFYFRYHHVLLDGYGQILFWRRLARVYTALAHDQEPPPTPFGSLDDLSTEEAHYRGSAEADRDRAYWLESMTSAPAPLDLARSGSGPAAGSGVLRSLSPVPVSMRRLNEVAADRQTHWSVVVIAAVAAYLRLLGTEDDIVVGFPVRARTTRTALTTPAMLSNELPLRLNVAPSATMAELVTHVSGRVRDVLAHQRHRGELLHRDLRARDGGADLPLVVVNVIPFDGLLTFGDCRGSMQQLSSGPVRGLSLDFYGGPHDDGPRLGLGAVAGTFGEQELAAHRTRLGRFLRVVIDAPADRTIRELDLLTPDERTQVVTAFNDTGREIDLTTTLPALFAAQAARTPSSIALTAAGCRVTYAELLDRADRLAAHLVGLGVRVGDVVGVHDVRSVEMVVGLLAVLRAGAAYLPLDPELPAARLAFQVEDAGVGVVLGRSTSDTAFDATVVPVDIVAAGLPALPLPGSTAGPDDPAYVIYTSGSTGRPKGVVVPHRGVVNRLAWMRADYGFGPTDCVLQKTSFAFDVSVWEFFLPLTTGARLHLLDPGAQRDPRLVARAVAEHGVTFLHFVPSVLDLFLDERDSCELGHVRHVFCSGEALAASTVETFFARFAPGHDVQLHNLYGPTEASVDVTAWRCLPGADRRNVPIGRPVANTAVYVLDPLGRPTPIGAVGELCIGGVQVARGYLRRPELTAQRFVPNPFGPGTLYRTGDLARWRHDGVVEFLGRTDHQIKVRGHRIEAGEVEAALLAHPSLAQAVVTAVGEGDGRRLVAHLVPAASRAVDVAVLRGHLLARVPSYMVPAAFVVLDALPLLANGKLDRAALPAPGSPTGPSGTPPSTPGERALAEVWAEVLGLPVAGVDESFFGLGGDSMLAIRIRTVLEDRHRLTFTVADLFAGPTVRDLATVLRPVRPADDGVRTRPFDLVTASDRERLPTGLDDAYPLTSMQAGMLYHVSYQEESSVYRVVTSVAVAAPLVARRLRAACAETVARHPQLRCSFDLTSYSEPLQLVHGAVEVPVDVADDLGPLSGTERTATVEAFVAAAQRTVFDLSAPPLLRFVAHPLGADAFQLTVVEHHVLLDGWSDVLMLEEVLDRYRAATAGEHLKLPAVGSTYRDFVVAERSALADPAARAYWTEMLLGAAPTAPAGRDARPAHHTADIERFDLDLPAELTVDLRRLARAEGLPLKSLLVAAHVIVLAATSGQDDVLTGMVANARLEEPGGDEVVGVFLNTLPMRVDAGTGTVVELARRILQLERDASPYRRYPFGQIQRDAGPALAGGLDSYVNFMDFHRERYRTGGSALDASIGVADTNYPLAVDFLVEPGGGRLRGWLDCDVTVLDAALCRRLTGYYRRALDALVADPHRPVTAVDVLGPDERARLVDWNGPTVAYDPAETLHGAVAAQARRTPDAPAVTHHWDVLTYAELDVAAARLARRLTAVGVRRGDRVGVSVQRGTGLLVALLGVLGAGAAYVPLDPTFPGIRLRTIAADAAITCLVRATGTPDDLTAPVVVDLDVDAAVIAALDPAPAAAGSTGSDLAYVMYTSGSTGAPKGAMVSHSNVVNFCLGMDDRVGCGPQDTVLAVTSVSFDISVLELLWPLMRGAHVVVADERVIENLVPVDPANRSGTAVGFSLFFFAAASATSGADDGYRLVLDAARYADTHGFQAIWTPERHFHEFGGLYPNPSVMAAALATVTDRIALRCGSVVAPLHDPVRMAEEWSLVDNLSNGRVGLAFASGWNSNDFVFFPERFADRKTIMAEHLDTFRSLWRGDAIERVGGSGESVQVQTFPRPRQAEPPIWLTSVGTVETFRKAGGGGDNLLTHLLGQAPEALKEKIGAYREARAASGHDGPGHVTVMVHTYLSGDPEQARREARAPFRKYLRSSTELWRTLFATTGQEFPTHDAESYLDAVIEQAIDRYFDTSGLFGSPESCAGLVRTLAEAGVDEIACLVDFGIPTDAALESLGWVDRLRRDHETEVAGRPHSLHDLCLRHGVTLLQGTPSLLSAVAAEPAALEALTGLRALLVGGEAFPSGLARTLLDAVPEVRVLNMYGPTETTIWSTVHELDRERDRTADMIPIGTPIANTPLRVLDTRGREVPVGVEGELWIGGDGVAEGYLGRPDLTADRFVRHGDVRFYRTGDRVRRTADGSLEFRGRVDRQVKIHGHRVEPDEVESVLSRHPDLDTVAVVAVPGPSGTELVAYVTPTATGADPDAEQAYVRRWTEVWQETYQDIHTGADGRDDVEFAGWSSSYTGERIPAGEMREWLGHTVDRIAASSPRAVADIGVGVGLVLREFADRTDLYCGLDISAAALAAAARCLGDRPLPRHVELVQAGPEHLAMLPAASLDAVVLNSVVQYFPSAEYLRAVLQDAIRVVRPGGAVHVGDVRGVEMLPDLHTSVLLHRSPVLHPVDELRAAAVRQTRDEEELCLSPAFFRQFDGDVAGVAEVRVEHKRGRADNELTRFRFDVTIVVGDPAPVPDGRRVAWAELSRGLDEVGALLRATPGPVTVVGVPNARLVRDVAARRTVASMPDASTVWDVERLLWNLDEGGAVHPEDIVDAARRAGREVRLTVPPTGRLDTVDARFDARPETGPDTDGEVHP